MPFKKLPIVFSLAVTAGSALAGPFAPAAGVSGSTAIHMNSTDITHWASAYQDYQPGANVDADWKTPEKALGAALGSAFDIVSLGDQGRITLSFGGAISNGADWDFAVFENSFNDTFLELAYVEVSSNGIDFFRFPSISFNANPVGAFGSVDPTNIDGLASKYRQGWGTPFDLDVLASSAGLNLNLNQVSFVRLVDIKGDGSEYDSYPSTYGGPHKIYDPFDTKISGGFDLDAIGVRYYTAPVPEPTSYALFAAGLGLIAWRSHRGSSARASSARI